MTLKGNIILTWDPLYKRSMYVLIASCSHLTNCGRLLTRSDLILCCGIIEVLMKTTIFFSINNLVAWFSLIFCLSNILFISTFMLYLASSCLIKNPVFSVILLGITRITLIISSEKPNFASVKNAVK